MTHLKRLLLLSLYFSTVLCFQASASSPKKLICADRNNPQARNLSAAYFQWGADWVGNLSDNYDNTQHSKIIAGRTITTFLDCVGSGQIIHCSGTWGARKDPITHEPLAALVDFNQDPSTRKYRAKFAARDQEFDLPCEWKGELE